MSLVRTVDKTEYPESDGRPMGETDLHREWMIRILDTLRYRFHGQRVYVACNLLVYYEQGDPSKFVVPDDFVVTDCDPGPRRTFKIWEEGKSPDVVFEVTSRATRREDESYKPQVYAQIGVKEYFLYDPTADYLNPPLQGLRIDGDRFRCIALDEAGRLHCTSLDLWLHLEDGRLVLTDARTGAGLLTEAEAERAARKKAEARAQELEAEVRRLHERLDREVER